MRAILAVALLAAMALAGCAEGGSGDAPDEDIFDGVDSEPLDEGKGLIRGVVLEVTITPIANATVTILGQGAQTTSNAKGAFVFTNLEPGTYFLEVSKPGYETNQASAVVEAGVAEPPIVKVALIADPESLPFHVPFYYELYISCSFKAANYVFDAGSCDPTGLAGYAASDDSWHAFNTGTTQNATWYQSEIEWEANQPASDGMVTIQCAAENTAGSHCNSGASGDSRLCNIRGASPLICRIGVEGTPPGGGNNLVDVKNGEGFTGDFSIGVYSNCAFSCVPGTVVGLGAALEQSLDVYAFVFYNYAPPEDWSFIETDKVPEPQ